MKKVILYFLLAVPACIAQSGYIHGNGAPNTLNPAPNCGTSRFYIDDSTSTLYTAFQGSPCSWSHGGDSPQVLFASQLGCALNTSLTTGGGTDDTVCIQNGLNALAASGGVLNIDGKFLLSNVNQTTTQTTCLAVPSNVTLHFLPGSGLFLKAASNCVGIGNVHITGNPAATFDTNMTIDGPGLLNFNQQNQSQYERADSGNAWNYCIWFGGFNGARVNDVTISNCPTFAILWSNGSNFASKNVTCHEDVSHVYEDCFHMWGTLNNGLIENGTSDAGDDTLAFNSNEGVCVFNGSGCGYTMNNSFGWGGTTTKNRFPWSGGNITNVTADHTYFNSPGGGVRLYGLPGTGGTTVLDNIVISDSKGNISGWSMPDLGVQNQRIVIDGWHVTGQNTITAYSSSPTLFNLQLTGIDPGAPITYTTTPNYLVSDYVIPASIYLNTTFNEASSGNLATTTPATCTAGSGCAWALSAGTDFTYQAGGGVLTATANTNPDLVNTGQANETLRFNLTTCTGTGTGRCIFILRYADATHYLYLNLYPATNNIELGQANGGTFTTLGSATGTIAGAYSVVLNGTAITVNAPTVAVSGTTVLTAGTNVGMQLFTGGTGMSVSSLSAKSH